MNMGRHRKSRRHDLPLYRHEHVKPSRINRQKKDNWKRGGR